MSFSTTRTTIISDNAKNIIYFMSTDNYVEFSKLINEGNVNNIIDTKNNYTALHYAVKFNNDKMIEYLLNMGANPLIKTVNHQDAFDLSLKYQTKCVFNYEIEELKETNKYLKCDVSALQKRINTLNTNNKYLDSSVTRLMASNDTLKKQVSTLTKEKNSAISEKISAEKEKDELSKECTILGTEMKNLKRKYDSLDQSYSGLLNKMRK